MLLNPTRDERQGHDAQRKRAVDAATDRESRALVRVIGTDKQSLDVTTLLTIDCEIWKVLQ